MKPVSLGRLADGKDLRLDVATLIKTRLLAEAGSGGGKSHLLRKILEATHGQVQQIVLDVEGEMASLREKFDYVLAGKGGDIPADPRSAELLARKILDLRVSIIVDLYELKNHERIRFVKLFLEAMINAPKELWHPCLVVIDEAHIFAPEGGKSEALSAVIDLSTRGRKRGFCAILATQRISKLHKDAVAECHNKLIGLTSLDIDRKRAADELGITNKKEALELRDLEPGEFFAFGPAISKVVVRAKIGAVVTKHPETGRAQLAPPAAPDRVKSILAKLTDLPKEAEAEARDIQSLRQKMKELERELRETKAAKPVPALDEKAIEKIRLDCEKEAARAARAEVAKRLDGFIARSREFAKVIMDGFSVSIPSPRIASTQAIRPAQVPARPAPVRPPPRAENGGGSGFGRCERGILKFLMMREGRWFTKVQVGALTEYSHGSGGFNNAVSKLHQAGLIQRRGNELALSSDAVETVKEVLGDEYLQPSQASLEGWLTKLPKCERAIYQLLLENPTLEYSKEELGELTSYSPSSGGFNNALSRLATLGLVERQAGGRVMLNREIMAVPNH